MHAAHYWTEGPKPNNRSLDLVCECVSMPGRIDNARRVYICVICVYMRVRVLVVGSSLVPVNFPRRMAPVVQHIHVHTITDDWRDVVDVYVGTHRRLSRCDDHDYDDEDDDDDGNCVTMAWNTEYG